MNRPATLEEMVDALPRLPWLGDDGGFDSHPGHDRETLLHMKVRTMTTITTEDVLLTLTTDGCGNVTLRQGEADGLELLSRFFTGNERHDRRAAEAIARYVADYLSDE